MTFGVVLSGSGVHVAAHLIVSFPIDIIHWEVRLRLLMFGVALVDVLSLKVLMVVKTGARVLLGQVNKVSGRSLPSAVLLTRSFSGVLFNASTVLIFAGAWLLPFRSLKMTGHFH